MKYRESRVAAKTALARLWWSLPTLFCVAAFALVPPQQPAGPEYGLDEAMISMRDGVHLYTQIYAPSHSADRLPILLLRTPYGSPQLTSDRLDAAMPELTSEGVNLSGTYMLLAE